MNVTELIEKLQNFEPDTRVIISEDMEGNSYRGIHEIDLCLMIKDGYGYSEVWSDDDFKDLLEKGEPLSVVIY